MPACAQVQPSSLTMAGSTTPSELKVPADTRKNSRLSAAKFAQGRAFWTGIAKPYGLKPATKTGGAVGLSSSGKSKKGRARANRGAGACPVASLKKPGARRLAAVSRRSAAPRLSRRAMRDALGGE